MLSRGRTVPARTYVIRLMPRWDATESPPDNLPDVIAKIVEEEKRDQSRTCCRSQRAAQMHSPAPLERRFGFDQAFTGRMEWEPLLGMFTPMNARHAYLKIPGSWGASSLTLSRAGSWFEFTYPGEGDTDKRPHLPQTRTGRPEIPNQIWATHPHG